MRHSLWRPATLRRASWFTLLLIGLPSLGDAQPRGGRGYLFDAPHGSLTLRLGASSPQAASEVFDFVSRQLTVNRADYRGAAFAADVAIAHSSRIETVLSIASSAAQVASTSFSLAQP